MAVTRTIETDVCVVGAGIVGLAHALEARRRGLSVVLLDREDRAAGASVSNSGHLFFTALGGEDAHGEAELAHERWLELARRARIFISRDGTLIVARHRSEMALLEAIAADPRRRARVLTGAEVGELAPIPTRHVAGGLHGAGDLRVDPRVAASALAALLAHDPRVRVEWRAHVHEVERGLVHADRLRVRAPAIVVCPGSDHRWLPPALRRGLEEVTLCRRQMLRLAAPSRRRYGPALTTGLSLLGRPGIAEQPGAAEFVARLELERGELIERGVQLVVTQLPDGDLIVGDAQARADTPVPFVDEQLPRLLLDEVRSLLGVEPRVKQRWQGTEAVLDPAKEDRFVVHAPTAGVRVVLDVSGLGMTLALGRAPAVLDELLWARERAPEPAHLLAARL